jgi:hypothetical protein
MSPYTDHDPTHCTNLSKQWDKEVIIDVLMAYVVLHNMILENKTSENLELAWQY